MVESRHFSRDAQSCWNVSTTNFVLKDLFSNSMQNEITRVFAFFRSFDQARQKSMVIQLVCRTEEKGHDRPE